MEDCLIVSYDSFSSDVATLMVARGNNNSITVLNTIRGNEASSVYNYLVGNEALEQQIKNKE